MIVWWRREREANPHWLSAREFFELLKHLFWEASFRFSPAAPYGPVQAWLDEHPGLRPAFPLTTILQKWEEASSR